MNLPERLEAVLAVELSYPSMDSLIAEEKRNELLEVLREAISLAKRYEDAPVTSVDQRSGGGPLVVSFLMDGKAEQGQRVRIVLDKEG